MLERSAIAGYNWASLDRRAVAQEGDDDARGVGRNVFQNSSLPFEGDALQWCNHRVVRQELLILSKRKVNQPKPPFSLLESEDRSSDG